MSEPGLFSEHWYRVRELRPMLAPDVQVARHSYRLQPVYVLHRSSTRQWHRLSVSAWEIVSRFNGRYSVQEIWEMSLACQGADAAAQAELISLLGQLHESDLLVVDTRLDAEEILGRRERRRGRDSRQRFLNPLSLRLSLWDPDPLVGALDRLLPTHVGRWLCAAMLLLWLAALFTLLPRWDLLTLQMQQTRFHDPLNVLMFMLIFPCMKLVHELAHAMVVKRLGGEVRDSGLALLVLVPNPYVDASAASLFVSKHHRMLVSAAGILAELSMAAIAALVWVNSEGIWQQGALSVMLIGVVSTLLFNGNPLLKFDAYHVLADWLEIPELASRSRRCLHEMTARMLGVGDQAEMSFSDSGERAWLLGYGILSGLYRLILMFVIAWMLSGQFFFFGMMLAVYVVLVSIVLPIYRGWAFLRRQARERRRRVLALITLVSCLFTGLAAALPLPKVTVVDGVVWLPEQAVLRIAQDCEVMGLHAMPGEQVQAGQRLFDCHEEPLYTAVQSLEAQLRRLDAQRAALLLSDPVEHQRLSFERAALQSKLELARERHEQMQVSARLTGRFLVDGSHDLPGRFLPANTVAGYVVPEKQRTIRLALTEADLVWLESGQSRVQVLARQAGQVQSFDSEVTRQRPGATRQLPTAALTTLGGGRLVAEQSDQGVLLRDPVFDIELAWPEQAGDQAIGSLVRVRFDHGAATLLKRLQVTLQQQLLNRSSS